MSFRATVRADDGRFPTGTAHATSASPPNPAQASNEPRAILHVDMDAFFASIEQRDDPSLCGKPVLVGGKGPRGVVAAASYEARKFGCRSAQPMAVARRACPHAIIVKPRGQAYREASRQVFDILARYSPLVEPISVDEAFVDITGTRAILGEPEDVARRIKADIKQETQLTASIGLAPSKLVAKIASDLDKPDGLVIFKPDEVEAKLAPLEIDRLWGVGPKAAERLARLGVRTFADMQALPKRSLVDLFGSHGESLYQRCRGIDVRRVTPDHTAKSISHETTFGENLADPDAVRAVMTDQAEQVAARLRAKERRGRTVTIKVRYGDFETITRSRTLPEATDRTDTIAAAARDLFDTWARTTFRPVRLIGVGVSELLDASSEQLGLFDSDQRERRRAVDAAADAINKKFGKRAIQSGRSLRERE